MPSFIKHHKDFWTGIIFVFFGLAAVIIGRDYPMGTAGRMGPAYFPTVLGWLLALVGVIAIVRSFFREEPDRMGRFAIKETILVLLGVILFAFTVRGGGLVIAVMLLMMVSAFASAKFKLGSSLAVAVGITAFAVLVFIKALGLPLAIIGPWFGG
ncbi:tripartite tricarboxylate transporter TctB family protein [uncultured Oxalicibacterium sp.]|uniref:tripartite tricarboxylate transporter TctB family protein n=1 Tax=uncultured Oxalicibacterium sp. TaxID=1168540 RepID=UPI0025E9B2BB|nr:tripartite tricarboxylate transporter TctB family protein [uncultured Oxalicibacterium sp.]